MEGQTATDPWGSTMNDQKAWKDNSVTLSAFEGFQDSIELNQDAQFKESTDPGNEAQGPCFSCGETGHRASDCPTPKDMSCYHCKQPGHIARECPDKPATVCGNCGEEGHSKNKCQNARKVNRDHVAEVAAEDAWNKLKQATIDRDMDDAKEAVQEYVKAMNGEITYRELQEAMLDQGISLFFIATERSLVSVFTNMDLQGNMNKKFSISYRFSERPDRPREAESFPKSREELLTRLDDAGEVVDSGRSLCRNCGQLGHVAKFCTEEKVEKPEQPKIMCHNCGEDGHRVRDCPKPRVDKFACRNCGKSGHRATDCEEPPNLDNVECRKCNEKGHFSRDCPSAPPPGCRNCGQEGHISRDCTEPRNMDLVTCRNCEKTGHVSRDCPAPKDWSKVQCSNCDQFGHAKVRCKEPLRETNEDSGFPAQDTAGPDADLSAADPPWPDHQDNNDQASAPATGDGW